MITSQESDTPGFPIKTLHQSPDLVRVIARRRSKTWLISISGLFVVFFLIGLFLVPQNYSTTVSVAMQQSSMPSALAAITGMAPGSKKYLGVLKSRSFAERVEATAHLQQIYKLKNQREAVDFLLRAVRFDDNVTDGLIYIDVTLPAPARLAPDPEGRREKVRQATVIIGNKYTAVLQDYLQNSDTDKELVLLRVVDEEMKKARAYYDKSLQNLVTYVKSSRIKPYSPPMISPSGGSGANQTADGTTGASQIGGLYSKKAQLEVQMDSAEALRKRTLEILQYPLQEVEKLPGEDALLFEARRQYNDAYRGVLSLQKSLGPENPQLVTAKSNLAISEARLREQLQAIVQGNTSDQTKSLALKAEYNRVLEQIADAETNFQGQRVVSTDLSRLSNEVALSLKALETTVTHSAELKLSTVPAQQRMMVIDKGYIPERSQPGLGTLIAFSMLSALGLNLIWFAAEYRTLQGQTSAVKKDRALP